MRLLKADIIVETGAAGGVTSSFILSALKQNRKGRLYSIELPRAGLVNDGVKYWRPDNKQPGWLIPSSLRAEWKLVLGNSKEELRPLLEKLREVDIFLHDSLHTFSHERFEYSTAWPYIKPEGLLLSDDVSLPYQEFCSRAGVNPIHFKYLGGIRKK